MPALPRLEGGTRLGGRPRPGTIFSARHVDSIDYEMGLCYESHILAHLRGRLRRRAEGGAGSGVLRRRLVTDGPGRLGTPPARHYDLAARSSLHGSGGNAGEGSAAPGPKSPRWSAERRARPAGRAPRLARRGPSRVTSATTYNLRLSALRSPLMGWMEKRQAKPGRSNAPRERRRVRCLTL